jgi:TolB-like protein/class 3 adenylate cyclase/Flp pilus assembly protein TadD
MTAARRLAAILVADVVGYSRLMGADEAGAAKAVRERREAATPIVRAFGGRLVKTMGDGVLLEFPSIVAAVECAIAIQKMMAEGNVALPEAKRLLYRVGVHLGDVLIEGDDILGDGVNVAARLEGVCEPGGISISGSAYEHVRGRIAAVFADCGEQTLKNIDRPVHAFALTPEVIDGIESAAPSPTPKTRALPRWPALAAAVALAVIVAGAYAWHAGFVPRLPGASVAEDKLKTAPRLSIVVLPFENLSGDPEQEYFADGITDDLTTDLSHIDGSFVISRGTAFTYKGKPVDAKQIGRELGVRYVLEGSVRRVGDKITINAQLISTETWAHVWADRFDGERAKLGELQVEFVSRLANSLGWELVKAESLRAARERPNNPDATDLAMQGWVRLNAPSSKANSDEAISLFERALVLDPKNMRAMLGLAEALGNRVINMWSLDPAKDTARAEEVIDAALALQPDSSHAHSTKGYVFVVKNQHPSASAEFETAIAQDPNNAPAYANSSFWKVLLGRVEFEGIEKALRLSPRDPNVPVWQFYMCHLYDHLAQWEQAIEWCNKAVTGQPGDWWTVADLTFANAWAGHDKEAKEAAEQLQKVYPGFTVQTWAGAHWTDNPTFNAQYQRMAEGLRKAGVPEGEKKTD